MNELPAGILLDLDDTILDDSGCVDLCWADACTDAARRLPGIDAAALQAAIQERARWWWSDPERHQRGRLDLRAATQEITGEVMAQLGVGDAEFAAEVAEHYRDLREERAAVIEGAIETLEALRECGVRLGLMTNGGGASQRAKIERFDLARHFDHIVIEGEAGYGKPDQRVFQSLLVALRLKPDETWAVGDNIEADVFGPMDAGIFGIWVDPSGKGVAKDVTRRPDRVIASIRELISENGGLQHG